MSNRRRVPQQPPSIEALTESSIMAFANERFLRAVRDWNASLLQEEERVAQELNDPQFAVSLGLPPDLPQFTKDILKRTMAVDRLGPQMPKREDTYKKFDV